MTKGTSEGKVRLALNQLDLDLELYKPPDDARNWKPADFLVWWRPAAPVVDRPHSTWIEVKECKLVGSFPLDDLRKSQRDGIRKARRLGIPYLLVVWWPSRRIWTISDAYQLDGSPLKGSVPFSVLAGKIGIDATQDNLPSTLRLVIEEGLP